MLSNHDCVFVCLDRFQGDPQENQSEWQKHIVISFDILPFIVT